MTRAASLLLLLLAAAACGNGGTDGMTVVFVRVDARPTVQPSSKLHVQVSNAGGTISQDFMLAGASFPRTFTVTPTGRTGDLAIDVTAIADDGEQRAHTTGAATIVAGQRVDVDLMLDPDDFLVNHDTVNTQWISFREDLAGRQLGVAPDGSFLISWENDCPLSRCDILARLFAPDTQAKTNATTMNDGDFIVNQTSEYTESSAIAASHDRFFVAWLYEPDTMSLLRDVKVTVLDQDGAHVLPGADAIASADPNDESAPTSFAREDGSFGVAWQRLRASPATGSEIRARLYSATGTELGPDFQVAATNTGTLTTPIGIGLPGGGFVIAWLDFPDGSTTTNVHARIFDQSGAPTTAGDLPLTSYAAASGVLSFGVHLAATPDGFVAGWQAYLFMDPIYGAQPLFMRRFDPAGLPRSSEILVTAKTNYLYAAPIMATHADGSIAVTWADNGDLGDVGASGAIKLRMFYPSGMPDGDPVLANTTTPGDQYSPSIAPLGQDAFLVAYTDGSGVPPDTSGSGVRARVVYPTLEHHDGTIGARCGGASDTACGMGLVCAASPQGQQLCHTTCTITCPAGGTCRSGACLFD